MSKTLWIPIYCALFASLVTGLVATAAEPRTLEQLIQQEVELREQLRKLDKHVQDLTNETRTPRMHSNFPLSVEEQKYIQDREGIFFTDEQVLRDYYKAQVLKTYRKLKEETTTATAKRLLLQYGFETSDENLAAIANSLTVDNLISNSVDALTAQQVTAIFKFYSLKVSVLELHEHYQILIDVGLEKSLLHIASELANYRTPETVKKSCANILAMGCCRKWQDGAPPRACGYCPLNVDRNKETAAMIKANPELTRVNPKNLGPAPARLLLYHM